MDSIPYIYIYIYIYIYVCVCVCVCVSVFVEYIYIYIYIMLSVTNIGDQSSNPLRDYLFLEKLWIHSFSPPTTTTTTRTEWIFYPWLGNQSWRRKTWRMKIDFMLHPVRDKRRIQSIYIYIYKKIVRLWQPYTVTYIYTYPKEQGHIVYFENRSTE